MIPVFDMSGPVAAESVIVRAKLDVLMRAALDHAPMKAITISIDYDWALSRIDALMDAKPGTAEFAELEALTAAVVAYENEHYPMDRSDILMTKHGDAY